MALILSFDTSTKVCSVALHESGNLLAIKESFEANSHSETLMEFIEEVLAEAGKSKDQLNAVAVSKGPGSYTGLRIGVSTAKGLAYGLQIPLIAVETLEALAMRGIRAYGEINETANFYVPMLDARRMEVYTMVMDPELKVIQPIEAKIIDESSFMTILEQGKIAFLGNGSQKCIGTIQHTNAVFIENIYTSAEEVGMIAFEHYQNDKFEDVAYFEPYYLKEFMTKPSTRKLL